MKRVSVLAASLMALLVAPDCTRAQQPGAQAAGGGAGGGSGKEEGMGEPDNIQCVSTVVAAGLAGRTEAILKRERESFVSRVHQLIAPTMSEPRPGEVLTTAMLHRGADSRDGIQVTAAAFMAGRCRASDEKADARLAKLLRKIAESRNASARTEAAMSLVLRGEKDAGIKLLREVAKDKDPFGYAWLEAYYLAQAGDPSGFPVIVGMLRGGDIQNRIMAARHLIAFRPFDGQTIEGQKVDIRALLLERLADQSNMVRQEMPSILDEFNPPDLLDLLKPLVEKDPDPMVQAMARSVIQRRGK